jgi:hypothetical protein
MYEFISSRSVGFVNVRLEAFSCPRQGVVRRLVALNAFHQLGNDAVGAQQSLLKIGDARLQDVALVPLALRAA